jgi:hypothetical protein
MKLIRQGDVILEKVEKIEGKGRLMNNVVLAEGEVTGHKHILQGQILECVTKDGRYVECKQDAKLTHQEHDTLTIPKGKYKVKLQREVDLLGEVKHVMD